jgi:peptidoglycan/LPS O-acetylase OafA/YrhL
MDLHIKKVWLPGAAGCLLFFGFFYVLLWLPFDKNRFQFMAIPYLVLPLVGALAAYWSRRMKGTVLQRMVSALFLVFALVAVFAVRVVYGLFFEGQPYTLTHFLAGLSVTLVFIVAGGLLLALGAWPFCRPHLREQLP